MKPHFVLAAPAVALWVGAWLGLALGFPALLIPLAACGAVAAVWVLVFRRITRPGLHVLAVVGAVGVLGALLAALRLAPLTSPVLQSWVAHQLPISADVTLTGEPVAVSGYTTGSFRRPDGWRATATLTYVATTQDRALKVRLPVEVGGSGAVPSIIPGSQLHIVGSLAPATTTRGVACRLRVRSWQVVRGPPSWQRLISTIRNDLVRSSERLPGDARGLYPGLTLGDTRAVPDDLTVAMKATGLTHLTAVSGGNLAVTLAIVIAVARALRLSRRGQVFVAGTTLGAFVVLVHAEPSVLRAAVMAGVALVGFVLGRPRAAVATLFASVVLLLLIDPWLARSWGFALSVAATGGLLLLSSGLTTYLQRWLPRMIAASLAVAVAAQVTTGPLISALAGGVPLASVPANLLAVPAAGPATAFGLATALLGPLWAPAAAVPTIFGGAAAWWIGFVARTFAALHLPVLRFGSGWAGAFVCAAVLVGCIVIVRQWPRLLPHVPAPLVAHARPLLLALLAVGVVAWFGVPRVVRLVDHWPPPNWVAVTCDVGQGDAIVLPTGPARAIVVDTGPEPGSVDRCLSDLGITRVDFVVLTHFHADHVEGLPGVLQHRTVGFIVTTGLFEPPDEVVRVAGWANARHIPVRHIVSGWSGGIGPVAWQTLWPLRYIRGQGSDPNNSSIVLLVRSGGVLLLLTGDVEPAAQQAIEAAWASPRVTVLKVPHHGSSHQAPEFSPWSGASVAVVSVGAGNPYGHPAASTIQRLLAERLTVARTDESGDLAIVNDRTGPALVRRRRKAVARCPT